MCIVLYYFWTQDYQNTPVVLNTHRNHKAYWRREEGGEGGMEVGEERDYIPVAKGSKERLLTWPAVPGIGPVRVL